MNLLESNRRRRNIRRWVIIATLPLTLVALLFVGKLLSMYAFAHQAVTSYVAGDYSGSTAAAERLELWNWFEPFTAPYNVGTALAGADELDGARTKLEEALPLAAGLEVCAVRVNLAIVIERQGDAAVDEGDGVGAAALYGEALLVTAETPKECSSEEADQESPDQDRSMSDTLDELEDRLRQKQQQPPPAEGETGQDDGPQQPDQDKLDEIQEKLEQGAEEREQNQQGDQDGPSSGTDKPW